MWLPPRRLRGASEPAAGSCAFVTGGPRANLPGIACVVRRLRQLQTRHAVVVAMPAAEVEGVRSRLPDVDEFLAWTPFPHHYRRTNWGRTNVLDKLNVLASPYARVVWLDPDMYVKEDVDDLCTLPANVTFAAVINAGVEERTCWAPPDPEASRRLGRPTFQEASWRCQDCAHEGASRWARKKPPCRFMLNTGVMSLQPLRSAEEFLGRVLEPIRRGEVASREGSDQGATNSLLYAHNLFEGVFVLDSAFNRLARVYSMRPLAWRSTRIIHFSGETKPWRQPRPQDVAAQKLRRQIRPLLDAWNRTCGGYREMV